MDLLRSMELNRSAVVDVETFLRLVRGQLNSKRSAVVRRVFQHLDRDGDGIVRIADVHERFVPWRDPDVEAGRKNRQQALQDLTQKLYKINREGRLNYADFVRYYEG